MDLNIVRPKIVVRVTNSQFTPCGLHRQLANLSPDIFMLTWRQLSSLEKAGLSEGRSRHFNPPVREPNGAVWVPVSLTRPRARHVFPHGRSGRSLKISRWLLEARLQIHDQLITWQSHVESDVASNGDASDLSLFLLSFFFSRLFVSLTSQAHFLYSCYINPNHGLKL